MASRPHYCGQNDVAKSHRAENAHVLPPSNSISGQTPENCDLKDTKAMFTEESATVILRKTLNGHLKSKEVLERWLRGYRVSGMTQVLGLERTHRMPCLLALF